MLECVWRVAAHQRDVSGVRQRAAQHPLQQRVRRHLQHQRVLWDQRHHVGEAHLRHQVVHVVRRVVQFRCNMSRRLVGAVVTNAILKR